MSASRNADAVANQGGEFSSRVPGSEPLQQGGHKPGVLASERDRAPEFSAQVLPPGSAPSDATYQPNPDLNNQRMYQSASSTLTGADSSDVHTGLGHPGQGQTSSELHHDGQTHRKKQGLGLGGQVEGRRETDIIGRTADWADQRALDEDVPRGQRGNVGGPPAEERFPETADGVASERK